MNFTADLRENYAERAKYAAKAANAALFMSQISSL
jgi:hypothetical protein